MKRFRHVSCIALVCVVFLSPLLHKVKVSKKPCNVTLRDDEEDHVQYATDEDHVHEIADVGQGNENIHGDHSNTHAMPVTHDSPCKTADRPNTGKQTRAFVAGVKFDIYIYDHASVGDIVSHSIKRSGSWEKTDTEKIMSHLSRSKEGVLLDVGANLGWFTVTALQLGHKVFSFEPFNSNVELLCASIAEIKDLDERFRLYNLGLDYRSRSCELFQQKDRNIGDTHSICDESARKQFINKGYLPLGWMNTTTLDDALSDGFFDLADHIDVMKVDVEGFEHAVVDGGNLFFQSIYAPTYVYMEMVSSMMGDAGGLNDRGIHRLIGVLLRLANYGYELDASVEASKELKLQSSPLEQIVRAVDGKNILFVRQQISSLV